MTLVVEFRLTDGEYLRMTVEADSEAEYGQRLGEMLSGNASVVVNAHIGVYVVPVRSILTVHVRQIPNN